MSNPLENRRVDPNLLTGGPKQLAFEGIERAAETIVSTKFRVSRKEKDEIAKKQPIIFPRYPFARYDRFSGDPIIARWPRRKKQLDKQQRVDLKDREQEPDKDWYRFSSVEHAIGGSVHILDNYQSGLKKSDEVGLIQRVESLYEFTQQMLSRFSQGEITTEALGPIFEEALELLVDSGFLKTRIDNRKVAVDQILKGLDLDSLNRLNPTISRMRLASASIKLFMELFISDKAVAKHQNLLLGLLQERELERFYIEQVIQETEVFLGLDIHDTSYEGKKTELYSIVLEMFRHNTVKIAPYRIPAFGFLFGSFGVPKVRSSGLSYLYDNMFGPNTANHIPNTDEIESDFKSSDSLLQGLFKTRLRKRVDTMKKALREGENKLKDYEEVIPSLLPKNSQESA